MLTYADVIYKQVLDIMARPAVRQVLETCNDFLYLLYLNSLQLVLALLVRYRRAVRKVLETRNDFATFDPLLVY